MWIVCRPRVFQIRRVHVGVAGPQFQTCSIVKGLVIEGCGRIRIDFVHIAVFSLLHQPSSFVVDPPDTRVLALGVPQIHPFRDGAVLFRILGVVQIVVAQTTVPKTIVPFVHRAFVNPILPLNHRFVMFVVLLGTGQVR